MRSRVPVRHPLVVCEFQKWMRMRGGKSEFFTEVDANGFRISRKEGERFWRARWASAGLTMREPEKRTQHYMPHWIAWDEA
jgi:hypothetical protein